MRKMVIGAAAAATLLAVWFAPEQDGGVVGPAAATTREAPTTGAPAAEPAATADTLPAVAPGAQLQIHPRVAEDDLGNVFAKQSWQADAPKKTMPLQAVQEQRQAAAGPVGAPALPFQFMGRFSDEGKTAYFLQIDGRNVVARPGDNIDDNYRLDSVSGDSLNFTYLPLHQKQSLVVGDTN
jgi:hypothetical protein